MPDVLISADDVQSGKPDPEGYNLAAARLDALAHDCLIFEDAPSGIAAAKAAGGEVIAITEAMAFEFDLECPSVENFNCISFHLGDRFVGSRAR